VGSYTITFTPDDVSNASAVVRVDLGAVGARITELTVRAGNGDGLIPGELPGFDLGRLLRAIAPAGQTAPAFELSAAPVAPAAAIGTYEEEPAAAAPAKRTAARATATRGATGRTPAKRGTATRGAAKQTTAKQTAAAKKTAAKAAAGAGRGARKAASATGTGRAATRTGAAAARTTRAAQGAGRAYRRTPDDIVAVFNQAPSATALARHYGVPRHTVQGWLRRLRGEGVLPPSSRATA
jgi:hypothetical protein